MVQRLSKQSRLIKCFNKSAIDQFKMAENSVEATFSSGLAGR
jgi:hypothetical protein